VKEFHPGMMMLFNNGHFSTVGTVLSYINDDITVVWGENAVRQLTTYHAPYLNPETIFIVQFTDI
jgi:hypothetical protein